MKATPMNDHQALLDLTRKYLQSIYTGDQHSLRAVFHPQARIDDVTTGTFRSRDVDQYLQAVAARVSPQASGEAFRMSPRSIDVLGDMAIVTAELRFLGNHFVNVLSLLRCEGQWLITHKQFGSAG
jgi:hypothetical protein